MRTELNQCERRGPTDNFRRSKDSALIAQHSVLSLTLCALLFTLCLPAHAQQAKKIPTVGFLLEGFSSSVSDSTRIEAFRKGLHEIGYTEGKNISIEYRFGEGKRNRLPDLAMELVRLNV